MLSLVWSESSATRNEMDTLHEGMGGQLGFKETAKTNHYIQSDVKLAFEMSSTLLARWVPHSLHEKTLPERLSM